MIWLRWFSMVVLTLYKALAEVCSLLADLVPLALMPEEKHICLERTFHFDTSYILIMQTFFLNIALLPHLLE